MAFPRKFWLGFTDRGSSGLSVRGGRSHPIGNHPIPLSGEPLLSSGGDRKMMAKVISINLPEGGLI
jgi:hypothetical protein